MNCPDDCHPKGIPEQTAKVLKRYQGIKGVFIFLRDYKRLQREDAEFAKLINQFKGWKCGPWRFWRTAKYRTARQIILNRYSIEYGRISTADHALCNALLC